MNNLQHYVANEGYIYDFLEPHYQWNDEIAEMEQIHVYSKELWIGNNDSIDNYIQVPEYDSEGNSI